MCNSLRPDEVWAQHAISTVLALPVEHWDTCGREGACDFRVQERSIVIEAKRITSEMYLRSHSRWTRNNNPFQSTRLARDWLCMIPLPMYEQQGTEQEAKDYFRKLGRRLEPLLGILEQRGITQVVRDDDFISLDFDIGSGLQGGPGRELWVLLRGGAASSSPATSGQGQITVTIGSGGSSSPNPNALVDAVDAFLNGSSDPAVDLRKKLTRYGSQDKHAFLTVDSTVQTWWAMSNWQPRQVPTMLPNLPPEIDQVWVAGYGHLVLTCAREGPWQAHTIPEGRPTPTE